MIHWYDVALWFWVPFYLYRSKVPLPVVLFNAALFVSTDTLRALHRPSWFWMDKIAAAVFLVSFFFMGTGLGRKLGKKLTSSALTAVNQASFRRQSKEAFS